MARQVLPIVGAAVGFWVGGAVGARWGYLAGSIVGNIVDPQVISGPKIGEAGLQTSAEGVFRPIVFGTAAVKGNVIERGNRQIRTKRERQGKGGPVTETERVYWTFAVRIGEPIAAVLRVWQDEKLVYDITPESTIVEESADFGERFRLYLGDESQLPDPGIEAYKGIGNVNAYRGTAYAVFPDFDLTDTGERIPDFRWEVSSALDVQQPSDCMALGSPSTGLPTWTAKSFGGATWEPGVDAAPADTATRLLGVKGGFLATDVQYTWRTTDAGDNWSLIYDAGSTPGGTSWDCANDDVVLIAHGSGGILRSTDDGLSIAPIPGSPASSGVVLDKSDIPRALSVSVGSLGVYLSTGTFDTWGAGTNHPIDLSGGFALAAISDYFLIGGRLNGGGYPPAVSITRDGASYSTTSLPSTGYVSCACGATIEGVDMLVCATSDGDLFWTDDYGDNWHLSADVFGTVPRGVVWNGLYFVMGGRDGGGGNGTIKYSADGKAWIPSTQPLTRRVDSVACKIPEPPTASGEPVPLGSIVSAVGRRPGLPASSMDVSELTDLVDGIAFAGEYTCADAIGTLMPIYMFGAAEYDAGDGYKIHFPMRGAPVVATLTIDDFIDIPDKTVREDALERPRVLHMHFENPAVGYVPAKASPRRFSPDVKVNGERSIQVPVVFSDLDEAWRRADVMLKVVYAEIGGEEEFTISSKWLSLVPTDNLGIVLRGQVRRLRLTESRYESGAIKCKFLPDRQSNYTSNLTGIELPPPTPPPPSIVGQTVHAVLDIPALNDNNDRLLWYEAATGQLPAWYGAQTQYKLAGATNFDNATTFSLNTIMGVLLDDVTAASEHYTDTTNVVRVQLYTDDEIDTLTNQQFLSEGGSFALANGDGTWEVLQYRDATDEGDGIFALSHLARGRLLTGATAHAPGQLFVLLDGVRSVDTLTAWLNSDIAHRAISNGTSAESAAEFTEEYVGRSQIEFPIASFTAVRDTNTITGNIVPRHRFGTEDVPVRSSNWQGFRITAEAAGQVNSITSLSEDFSIDVTGFASPVNVTISQMNRLTGAGPTVSESIA